MPRPRLALSLLAVLLAPLPALAGTAALVQPGFKVERMRRGGAHQAVVYAKDGKAATVEVTSGAVSAKPANLTSVPFAPKDMIPGAQVATSIRVSAAYLADGTDRYRHAALGDGIEAQTLIVRESTGTTSRVEAGDDAVFEDLQPRIADIDGDGFPEILVVRSLPGQGAQLAVVMRREGKWAVAGATPPIGQPNRWLNPAAVADFDGDGKPDIALVRAPHTDGVLEVWTWRDGALVKLFERAGYANHAHGSTALDLAAAADIDGDGVPELALPTLDRRSLAIVSLKGEAKELQRVKLPGRARTGVLALGAGREARILVGLEDGRLAAVKP